LLQFFPPLLSFFPYPFFLPNVSFPHRAKKQKLVRKGIVGHHRHFIATKRAICWCKVRCGAMRPYAFLHLNQNYWLVMRLLEWHEWWKSSFISEIKYHFMWKQCRWHTLQMKTLNFNLMLCCWQFLNFKSNNNFFSSDLKVSRL